MMALHPRKFLFAEPGKVPDFDKRFSTDCYMCYVCPENCYIPPPPPQLSHPDDPARSHVSTVVILMLCILGVAFLVLSYLTIARYRCRRRNPESLEDSRADENQGPVLDHPIWYIRTVGLPQSVIDSIALFHYKKGDGLIDGHDCSVCLNYFQENESLRLLPKCSHAFHVVCIDTWLTSHLTCPVCRAPVLLGNANNARLSTVESSFSESTQGENEFQTRPQAETDGSRDTMRAQEDPSVKFSSKNRNQRLRVLSDLADRRVRVDDQELQAVRRSVSMDFSSASVEKRGEAGCSETTEKQNSDKKVCKNCSIYRGMMKCSSYSRSLQKGPVSMKRSFSSSGKRSLRKNSRSHESIQIPEIRIENCGP